jgi:hypothetical protein
MSLVSNLLLMREEDGSARGPRSMSRSKLDLKWPVWPHRTQISLERLNLTYVGAWFSFRLLPQILICKKKIFRHIKISAYVWSTKCR